MRILMMIAGDIADTLRMTPYIKAVRHHYSDASLSILVSERGAEALERCPYVDEIIIRRVSQGGLPGPRGLIAKVWHLLSLGRRLRGRFDLVLGSHGAGPLWNTLAFATAAPRRIGYDLSGTGFLLTKHLGRPDNSLIDEQRMERLVEAAGVCEVGTDPYMELWPSEEDDQDAAKLLCSHGLVAGELLIAICPGSDWSCQQWQIANWAAVADALGKRFGARFVILGHASEGIFAQRISALMVSSAVNLTGKTPRLGLLAEVLRRCGLALTLESAPSAVAMAVGIPVVALFGSIDVWIRGQHRAPAIGIRKCAGLVPTMYTLCKLSKMRRSIHRCQQDGCIAGDGLTPITPRDVVRSAAVMLSARTSATQVERNTDNTGHELCVG